MDNEEGRRISGMYSIEGDDPEQVNAHAATLWELRLLNQHYDPNIQRSTTEYNLDKSMRVDQRWKEVLKKDYQHKIFDTKQSITKKKSQSDDDI